MRDLCLTTTVSAVCLVTLLVACNAGLEDSADTHVVVGTIAAATMRDDGYAQFVLVDCMLEPSQASYDSIFVLALEGTHFFLTVADGSLTLASREDLVEGSLARVYHSGIMLRSDPPGVMATRVEITKPE